LYKALFYFILFQCKDSFDASGNIIGELTAKNYDLVEQVATKFNIDTMQVLPAFV
jgi:hypothetical protein